MKFEQYDDTKKFGADVIEILLRHEVQNNLPISFIKNEQELDTSNWLMTAIKSDEGNVLLTAACTPPFNLVLYETDNIANEAAVNLLSNELKSRVIKVPGVLAEQSLAQRFAEAYNEKSSYQRNMSMNIMRLDQVADISKAPGYFRPLREEDLFFAPYWERAFGEECKVEFFDLPRHIERLKKRIDKNTHYIWEDGIPVSQAVQGRATENGAVINGVYTPPPYRGKGYASSIVAALSRMMLENGHTFCCLFADAENPISCGIYRKIGYQDQCVFDEIKFDGKQK